MASEIRVNTINSTAGFGTITVSETGQDLVGITTIENLTTENTLVGAAASFTGNVQVGGVLTYEDVTNIDSVGLITARQGIEIGARPGVAASISVDGNMIVSGISTFKDIIYVADKILHDGDGNTGVRFPAADTFAVETAGTSRLRVGSGGDISVGSHSTNYADSPLEVRGTNAGGDVAIRVTNNSTTAGSQAGLIFTTTTADYTTAGIAYERGGSADALRFYVGQSAGAGGFDNATERLRIDANGNMGLGVTPSANWVASTDFRALQIGSGLVLYGRGSSDEDRGGLTVNAYHTGSAWKYLANGNASNVYLNDGNTDIQYASTNSGGADAGLSWSTAFRSTSGGQVCMGNYHTSNTIGDYTPALQVGGTNASSACISINRWTNDAAGACLQLFKGRGTSGGAVDKGQDGDVIGSITWVQANNNNLNSGNTARIDCNIDAAPGGGDYPSRLTFWTCPDGSQTLAERLRIDKDGICRFNTTVNDPADDGSSSTAGTTISQNGYVSSARNAGGSGKFGRNDNDGVIINLYQDGTAEGNISVSGSTVSYNGGHLSRWSQFVGLGTGTRPTIYQGTVLSNLDEMCEWDGEENQQLNKTKVSDTVGDKDVAGVFWSWDNLDPDDAEKYAAYPNDFYIAMTGDMVIRVAGSTSVARGDLMESAGDGTAKPQSDDIVRSKTIAKITSTTSTATYADGSKAYPCVLMAC